MKAFTCAAKSTILLQGMMYITVRCIYFYSPFNDETLIGYGTKLKFTFEQIKDFQLENNLIIYPNSIRVVLHSKNEILFTSFISRDSCY